MLTSYRTISSISEGFYKEKGSKFYAYAYPIASTEQITSHLSSLRKLHHQARHHCYAYILGPDGKQYRSQDDGEPKHSAGDPILGQIRSKNLTNVLVVVVRYFGGTKLGMGGLIQAYKEAAHQALNQAQVIEKELCETWQLEFDYELLNLVMRYIKDMDLNIVDQQQTERASFQVEVPLAKLDIFKSRLAEHHKITSTNLTV